jgi:type 1 glutamine amidotransferase
MKALITRGGWVGHEPVETSEVFRDILIQENFEVEIVETLDCFLDAEALKTYDLVVPIWTMSTITKEQTDGILAAVESGVGIAGNHGGMCDAFRQDVRWQFMTGGQWVAHPGNAGVTYEINIKRNVPSFIVSGINDFKITVPGVRRTAYCQWKRRCPGGLDKALGQGAGVLQLAWPPCGRI